MKLPERTTETIEQMDEPMLWKHFTMIKQHIPRKTYDQAEMGIYYRFPIHLYLNGHIKERPKVGAVQIYKARIPDIWFYREMDARFAIIMEQLYLNTEITDPLEAR